jgi:hypothetical protein
MFFLLFSYQVALEETVAGLFQVILFGLIAINIGSFQRGK